MKRTLIIDGNFMMNRILYQYSFIDTPIEDRNNYLMDLSFHLAKEIERVAPFCDNIVIVKDGRSWRKKVEIVKPLDLENVESTTTITDYKANRVKDNNVRNYELIYSAFNEFCDSLNTNFNVAVTHIDGAEGDDAIYAWTQYLRSQRIKTAIYCTDSDLSQLVTLSNVILRRIKSKVAPEGEIVIHPQYHELLNKAMHSTSIDVFSVSQAAWTDDLNMIGNKKLDEGLVICHPAWFVLVHMIIGSTKDNVPELFTWKSTNGKTNRHISEKHIIEALATMDRKPSDIIEYDLYDVDFLTKLFISICNVTKQTERIKHVEHHIKMLECNRKLNYLSYREIPTEVLNSLLENIKAQSSMKADLKRLSNTNLLQESLHVTNNKIFQNLGL